MKKIVGILFIIVLSISFVSAIDLSSSFLQVGKELLVYGDGFGNNPGKYDGICFDNDSNCFVQGSDGLILRSDKIIKIWVPSNVPLKGKIKVYVNSRIIGTLDYVIKPFILDISDGTYIKKSGGEGEKILIQGKGFGNYAGNVYFGNIKAKINSWSENKIWLNLPKSNGIVNNIRVENAAGILSDFYEFDLYNKISNDEYSAKQEYLNLLLIKDIWKNYPKLGDGITIAVLDVGVKLNHPDLIKNLWINKLEIPGNGIDDDENGYVDDIYGWNFVENNNNMSVKSDHGTMIAGIIAAQKDNGIGIAGIAPNAKIMTLKIFDNSLKKIYNIDRAVKYAVDNGANIINLSFGSNDLGSYEKDFNQIFEYAYQKGVVLTVAAGNTLDASKQDLDKYPNSPICNDGNKNYVIGVASVNNKKIKSGLTFIKSDFSRYGSNCIDVSTLGENIFSTSDKKFNSGNIDYANGQGTSFATPIVAGAIALLWSNRLELKNIDIYKALKKTGDDIDIFNPKYKGKLGKYLNIEKLMKYTVESEKEQGESGSGIDKKALTMFSNIQAQMKTYPSKKKQDTYKSIYKKLDQTLKSGKELEYVRALMKLVEGEMNK